MAYKHIRSGKDSFLGLGRVEAIALNSFACESGMLLKETTSGSDIFIDKAVAGSTIVGISSTEKTFDSDNQTVAKAKVNYVPRTQLDTIHVQGVGQTIVFDADFVTSNKIDMKVNGVSMTQVSFNTDNATTLAALVTQLNTNFGTVATFTASGAHTVNIVPVGNQASVVVSNIAVTGGSSQAVGTWSLLSLTIGDRHKYYDITAAQYLNMVSESTSTGQLLCEDPLGMEFSIANA